MMQVEAGIMVFFFSCVMTTMKQKGQANRQRIVDAANDLFYQQGYNTTSFAEVAEASGVPKGNFYYYFKSKDELLEAVIEMRLKGIRAMLTEWEVGFPEPIARLKRFAQIPLDEADNVVRYGCPLGSLSVELSKTQLHLHSHAREMFDLFLEWLESRFRQLGKGEVSRSLALHMLAMAQGAVLLGSVYADKTFLEGEVARINAWLDTL